mmetsp:Transcript_39571/g.93191  ORF Transcript_39571/g.93191 Transcript_39571/m.93191 type:complete len:247 (-) Transcript_39571:526-1266(-)
MGEVAESKCMPQRLLVARHGKVWHSVSLRMPVHGGKAGCVSFAVVLQIRLRQLLLGEATHKIDLSLIWNFTLSSWWLLESRVHPIHHAEDLVKHGWSVQRHEEAASSTQSSFAAALAWLLLQLLKYLGQALLHSSEGWWQERIHIIILQEDALILLIFLLARCQSSTVATPSWNHYGEIPVRAVVRDGYGLGVASLRQHEAALPLLDNHTILLRASHHKRPSANHFHSERGTPQVSSTKLVARKCS